MKGEDVCKKPDDLGDAPGKRPKRKCLQWHPLLSKRAPDLSEEEEEQDDEEELAKDQISQDQSGSTSEEGQEEAIEKRARRPMNAFLLFCKRHRSLVRHEHPRLDNRGATKILADWWAVLEPAEKLKYTDMAKEYKEAFMKANPGYKWCPTTSKPVKRPSCQTVFSPRKKVWSLVSNASKDLPTAKKLPKTDVPQLNFAMADPTKMGGLSMLLLAGEHALASREGSLTTKPSLPDTAGEGRSFPEENQSSPSVAPDRKSCRRSALFQLAEMCLASEDGKVDTDVSQQGTSSSSPPFQKSTAKSLQVQEENLKNLGCPLDSKKPLPSSSVTLTQTFPLEPDIQNRCLKKENDKKEGFILNDKDKTNSSKQFLNKCTGTESNTEIVFGMDTLAESVWNNSAKPKMNIQHVLGGDNSGYPKKKSKPKVKTSVKDKELKYEQHSASKVKIKEGMGSMTETEQDSMEGCQKFPYRSSLMMFKEYDNRQERTREVESNMEIHGSRKSERRCKGALYKTLVSEGMLTSLRANIDRGKRGVFRAAEHEVNCGGDSWTLSQMPCNNPKRLKRFKSKDDSSQGKLEEEFEKKFNSLPQYNPVTFDKKGPSVIKKKKTDWSCGHEETSKAGKGSFSSTKKTSFHKIVKKHKHLKDKPDATICPDVQCVTSGDILVGSQKRKARKTKITHLVRTADGRTSLHEEEKIGNLTQVQEITPLPKLNLCNDKVCYSTSRPVEGDTGTQELPGFFSLAALAEVATMENILRGQKSLAESLKRELAQTPVLISCADQ
ncbi:HMG box transcription factor BBX isoform X2 [Corythoichthys intestinalis]|uniref:HMG box transcription factor BBX isoform X2 n=1 Tax=Corythoichthys intestinalis TaxID=161448 RepID=UPI0025A63B69|nr:HMG box transcription factor BBX isoform X2 [Corythoichthys intestinalis]